MRRNLKVSSMKNSSSSTIHAIHEISNQGYRFSLLFCADLWCFLIWFVSNLGVKFCDQMLLQKKITLPPCAVWSVSLIRASIHWKLSLFSPDLIWRAISF